tara:strand:+ start:893 stop:1462 length:570 start_codon:yes stop_codon:yes gene_type:complete
MRQIPVPLIIILGFCLSLVLLEEESESTTPPAAACNCDNMVFEEKINTLEERIENLVTTIDSLEQRLGVLEQDKAAQEEKKQSEENFCRWVLDNYVGRSYYHNKRPPSIGHLVEEHGLDRDVLNSMNLSSNERAKIHGAAHTNTMEELRAAHAGTGTIKGQKNSVSKTGDKTRYRIRCVNGKCYRERIN